MDVKTPSTPQPEQTQSVRVAHVISNTFNPLIVAVPTFLLVSVYTAPNIMTGILWFVIPAVGISIVPIILVARAVQQGHLTDMHISIREQRITPMILGLASTVIVFILLLFLHASKELLATLVALLIGGIITIVITKFWKISLHLVGIAGATTTLSLAVSPWFLLLSPLVVLVGWARWKVGAHSFVQAIAGTVLAAGVTALTFWAFSVLSIH